MFFNIGNVYINDSLYSGKDLYSDGPIEDEFLNIAQHGRFEEVLKKDNRWPVLYHFSDIRENLLEWYPFSEDGALLEIGAGCGGLTGLFCRKVKSVTAVELSMKRSMVNAYRNHECDNLEIIVGNFEQIEPSLKFYDYITLIGVWEYSGLYISEGSPYTRLLQLAKKHLKPNGKIFIAIENKMGIKYWNGALEDHIGKQFAGLRNYVDTDKVRTFSKPEIEDILQKLSFNNYTFYYPMPDYKLPNVIYSDEYLPLPGDERNFGKDYSSPRHYLYNDALIMDQICDDKMFPYFANSFLIVIGDKAPCTFFSKYNRIRNRKYRTKVEILPHNNEWIVKKSPLNREAQSHITQLVENETFCKDSVLNMSTSKGCIYQNSYVSNYIIGVEINNIFYKDRECIDKWINYILELKNILTPPKDAMVPFYITEDFSQWFGTVPNLTQWYSLKKTNVDLGFSNIKNTSSNQLVCIDYEWVFDFPIPYTYVWWRALRYFYDSYSAYLNKKTSLEEIYNQIGISPKECELFTHMEYEFMKNVLGYNYSENYLTNYVQPIC